MDLRKLHNNIKRQLIQSVAERGCRVLDVGCGRGGDAFKWLDCGVHLTMCDPDEELLNEAKSRCWKRPIDFHLGDISATPEQVYDIICYNFSFQYTFASDKLFYNTIRCIHERSKVGTKFIGVVPDSGFILNHLKYTDSAGNYFIRSDTTGNGSFGEKLWVCVKNTVYYQNNDPISEPIAYKDIMITEFESLGWSLDIWEPIVHHTTGLITDMYSRFIFTRIH